MKDPLRGSSSTRDKPRDVIEWYFFPLWVKIILYCIKEVNKSVHKHLTLVIDLSKYKLSSHFLTLGS